MNTNYSGFGRQPSVVLPAGPNSSTIISPGRSNASQVGSAVLPTSQPPNAHRPANSASAGAPVPPCAATHAHLSLIPRNVQRARAQQLGGPHRTTGASVPVGAPYNGRSPQTRRAGNALPVVQQATTGPALAASAPFIGPILPPGRAPPAAPSLNLPSSHPRGVLLDGGQITVENAKYDIPNYLKHRRKKALHGEPIPARAQAIAIANSPASPTIPAYIYENSRTSGDSRVDTGDILRLDMNAMVIVAIFPPDTVKTAFHVDWFESYRTPQSALAAFLTKIA